MKIDKDIVLLGDCVEILTELPQGSVDLIFADPPFNIGKKYSGYCDNKPDQSYLHWTRTWLREAINLLKENGSLYVAIGDEYAGDVRVILREFPVYFRNWIIWYYTFGQHMKSKFNRSHTHILYFVKDPNNFTFNDDAIRVPSARQKVYHDKRANPRGKIPDDVWKFSRVCGTFKERLPNHPCQMPEKVLERIIMASSNPGDIVLDPFAGTGTTLAVALKLNRHYVGIEFSEEYHSQIMKRLELVKRENAQLNLFTSE